MIQALATLKPAKIDYRDQVDITKCKDIIMQMAGLKEEKFDKEP
jgi:hypothetical protein